MRKHNRLSESRRSLVIGSISVVLFCQVCHAALAEEQERGDLGLLWDGIGNMCPGRAWISVCDDANNRLVENRVSSFLRPIVVPSLAYGNVRIGIVPQPIAVAGAVPAEKRPKGMSGDATVVIDAAEVTSRILLRAGNAAMMSLTSDYSPTIDS